MPFLASNGFNLSDDNDNEHKQGNSDTGCSLNIVFFQRILESLPPLSRQHLAAIGSTQK